jgi:dienelactone hydrolase
MQLRRFAPESAIPIAAGLTWLYLAGDLGVIGLLFAVLPGCLLLASGVALLFWPGDLRIPQFAAAGGVVGALLALPAALVVGIGSAALLFALSAAAFLAAGAASVRQELRHRDVPLPVPSLRLFAEVAADDALLAWMQVTMDQRSGDDLPRIAREVEAAAESFRAQGWLEKPADYHQAPPPLISAEVAARRVRGIGDFEHLTFESGYEPRPGEPGRERWLSYAANRTAHAWILRHPGPPRPWLVCIHGFQMGTPLMDLSAFAPAYWQGKLGLNLALPVLPLHGARAEGRSGDRFLAGDALDSIHAEAQAMWDIRRLISWIRAQGATAIGVTGLSLGGYQAALLAGLESELCCAIPGIPLADITRAVWRHGSQLHTAHAEHHGIVRDHVAEVLRVVSPLAIEPKVPFERRFIFGAICDQLVPSDQVRDLWEHWGRCKIAWYQGAHLTFRAHPHVHRALREALVETGLVSG